MTGRDSTGPGDPVRATDRVSAVLARDPALVEVFVRLSPAFERLRNPAMRRVMARLVTIEHAAAIAGITPPELIAALNHALGVTAPPHANDVAAAPAAAPSSAAARTAGHDPAAPPRIREVDVRDDLRSGREPFSRIMAAVAALAPDEGLVVRATFRPVPLIATLERRGFTAHTTEHGADDWTVVFSRWHGSGGEPAEEPAPPPAETAGTENVVWLDVRDLVPPEPMERTLAALEALPPGAVLAQLNVRVPRFLLPVLAERGFQYDVDDSEAGRVIVRIWRRG